MQVSYACTHQFESHDVQYNTLKIHIAQQVNDEVQQYGCLVGDLLHRIVCFADDNPLEKKITYDLLNIWRAVQRHKLNLTFFFLNLVSINYK